MKGYIDSFFNWEEMAWWPHATQAQNPWIKKPRTCFGAHLFEIARQLRTKIEFEVRGIRVTSLLTWWALTAWTTLTPEWEAAKSIFLHTNSRGISGIQVDSRVYSEKFISAPSSVQDGIQILEEQIIFFISPKFMWGNSKGFQNGYLLQAPKCNNRI